MPGATAAHPVAGPLPLMGGVGVDLLCAQAGQDFAVNEIAEIGATVLAGAVLVRYAHDCESICRRYGGDVPAGGVFARTGDRHLEKNHAVFCTTASATCAASGQRWASFRFARI